MSNFWGAYQYDVLAIALLLLKNWGVGWGLSIAESLQLGIVMYLYTIKIK